MSEKMKLKQALVVEGKYDKIKLASLVDGVIITTHGFGIYKDKELCALLRFYAEKTGLIVMTDSDAAGRQIRAYIKQILPKELQSRVLNLHIPQIKGKERRKAAPSKEGTLGVEGISAETLRGLLENAGAQLDGESAAHGGITGSDMYMLGLSGTGCAAEKRVRLAEELGLPEGLSAHALLDVLNSMYTPDSLAEVCGGIFAEREDENGAV